VALQLGSWGDGLTIPHREKKKLVTKCYTGPRNWTDGPVVDPCEHCNEPSGSITSREFLSFLTCEIRLIKMCLNEPYSKDSIGSNMSDAFPIHTGLKQGGGFIVIDFQLCRRICHQVGPRKSGRIGIEWGTSASSLC